MLYVTYLQLAVALLCFVLVPVRYPRELFYPPEALGWADAFWRWFDTPTNCLPSLHVANGLALAQLNWTRRWRGVHTLWALGVAASTVLVKQHYVADAVAGAGLYLLARAFLTRLVIAPVAVGGGSRVPQATTYGWPAGSLTSP
jgi:membrane-associated phospholipid phosphatase